MFRQLLLQTWYRAAHNETKYERSARHAEDMRKKQLGTTRLQAKGREAYAALKRDHFFQELHQSVGEPLPEDEETGSADDPWFQDSPALSFAIFVSKPFRQFTVGQFDLYGHASPPLTVSRFNNSGGLQRRYIQACQSSDLYCQLQAEWSVLQPVHEQIGSDLPIYSTFRRRWNTK